MEAKARNSMERNIRRRNRRVRKRQPSNNIMNLGNTRTVKLKVQSKINRVRVPGEETETGLEGLKGTITKHFQTAATSARLSFTVAGEAAVELDKES